MGRTTHPGALAGDELVVLRLHAGPAADVKVLGLEVGVVQLLWSLRTKTKGKKG